MPTMSGTSPPRNVASPRNTTISQLRSNARTWRLKRAKPYAADRAAEPMAAAGDAVVVPAACATSISTAHIAAMHAATVMIAALGCFGC
jgi:hypothetical protein